MIASRRRFMAIAAGSFAGAALPRLSFANARTWRGRAFGTDVHVVLPAIDQDYYRVVRSIERELLQIEKEFSLFADSALFRLNETGILRNPGERILDLLTLSGKLHQATGGAFDPTVQAIWLAHAGNGDVAAARTRSGWQRESQAVQTGCVRKGCSHERLCRGAGAGAAGALDDWPGVVAAVRHRRCLFGTPCGHLALRHLCRALRRDQALSPGTRSHVSGSTDHAARRAAASTLRA